MLRFVAKMENGKTIVVYAGKRAEAEELLVKMQHMFSSEDVDRADRTSARPYGKVLELEELALADDQSAKLVADHAPPREAQSPRPVK